MKFVPSVCAIGLAMGAGTTPLHSGEGGALAGAPLRMYVILSGRSENVSVSVTGGLLPVDTDMKIRDLEWLELIDATAAEATNDGWDGEGSSKVQRSTARFAKAMVSLFPPYASVPEVSITPSGSISFDWSKGTAAQVSVMVPRADTMTFAGYFNGDQIHGSFNGLARQIPREIVTALKRWSDFDERFGGA